MAAFPALAGDGDTKVKIGKTGVSVETGSTKVDVSNDDEDTDVEEQEAEASDDDGLVINGVSVKKVVTCKTPKDDVVVNGTSHEITVHGECKSVTVNGTGHKVSIDAAGAITVNGTGLEVRWKKGLQGKDPKIAKSGTGIKVIKVEK